jgi:hypothetical protein
MRWPSTMSTCGRNAGPYAAGGSSSSRPAGSLQLTPVTDALGGAREWFEVLPAALGTEGLDVKGAATRYAPGRRDWIKVNSVGVESVWAARRELVVRGQAGVRVLPAVRDRCRGRVVGGLVAELGRGSRGLVESKARTLSSSTAGRAA